MALIGPRLKHPQNLKAGTSEALHLWGALTLACLVFVVYGSLVPLDFRPLPWGEAVARFHAIPWKAAGASRIDHASNVLLTVPLAFAAAQFLLQGRAGPLAWLLRALILISIFAVSVGVEFTQLYFPSRTTSWSDIQAQTLGSTLGLLAQYRWGGPVSQWLLGWWGRERRSARLSRVLKAYLAVLLGFSLLPLDLTINPVDLYHKWSDGRVHLIPFSGLKGSLIERLYELATDVAIWIPVGILLQLDRPATLKRNLVRGMALALVIEFLQLFVFSRVSDITDVLLAGSGVLAGGAIVLRKDQAGGPSFDQIPRTTWVSGWTVWLLVTLAIFWFPFNFQLPTSGGWSGWLRVPFATYQMADEFKATNEVLRRLGFFLPGGLLWGLACEAAQRPSRRSGIFFDWLPLLAVALLVEVGQVFLPGKVADLTDAGLAALGGLAGLRLARWLAMPPDAHRPAYRVASSAGPSRPARPVTQSQASGKFASRFHGWAWAGWLLLAAAIALLVNLPGVPYNARELVAVGPLGLVSSLALAGCIVMMVSLPMLLINRSAGVVLVSPLGLLLGGLLAYAALRVGVPLESIHDVVGAPIWRAGWEWERMLRFAALWVGIGSQMVLACLLVETVLSPRRFPIFLCGLIVYALLAYPLYWVVVSQAATDNLTELIADRAAFSSMLLVATGICCVFVAGASLSACCATPSHWRRLMPLTVLCGLFAALSLTAGLEDSVVKYGKVFSALQFLLSSGRTAYVSGAQLWGRFGVALSMAVFAVALLQAPWWRQAMHTNGLQWR